MKPFNQVNRTREAHALNRPKSIHEKLQRILQTEEQNSWAAGPDDNSSMITKVIIRPNPFDAFIALEIHCVQSKHLIIRMTDEGDRIVKMFSWFVVKGANVTTFTEMESLAPGTFFLDVMDREGEIMFSTELVKK